MNTGNVIQNNDGPLHYGVAKIKDFLLKILYAIVCLPGMILLSLGCLFMVPILIFKTLFENIAKIIRNLGQKDQKVVSLEKEKQ